MASLPRKTPKARSDLSNATLWITPLAAEHGERLVHAVSERSSCAAGKARRIVRQLVELGWLLKEGPTHRPRRR